MFESLSNAVILGQMNAKPGLAVVVAIPKLENMTY